MSRIPVEARSFKVLVVAFLLTIFIFASFFAEASTKATKAKIKPIKYSLQDGTELQGWVSIPDRSGKCKLPGILLIHGGASLSGNDERFGPKHMLEIKAVQRHLGADYAIFSVEYKSEYFGDSNEFSSIIAAYNRFIAEPYVDPSRIALVGVSHGGFLALLGALDPDNGIDAKAVVDISGVVDLAMHVRFYEKRIKEEPKLSNYDKYAVSGVKRRLGWPPDRDARTRENFRKRSALSFIKSLDIPLLVIHGKSDKFVPFAHAEALVEEAKRYGKKVELVAVPGRLRGNHFLIASRGAVWRKVAEFLDKNL